MRLKHLELHGYKTFASRTEFAFDGGITAIVGPNGSGKSNIADAIRWVLGEQSYRALRGKRTEDMIFHGSAQRVRLGMALASLTLDNADGWLPIDFAEVTITRRAYRSGENEYLLNGSRVRLRDISELLAKSGLARRTYTVIGQGLVDAVLSLRPEDRRALFEESAGIALYQAKRGDAVSRLEETHANLLRVNDIINEIAPRLRRLERESERAEHHALLSRQLEGLLRTWYAFRWREEQRNLRRARDALVRREESLARRREALEAQDEQMATLRARQSEVREQLGAWHRESAELHRKMEGVQRDLAVWQERARQLMRQGDELRAELVELEAQGQALSERLAASQEEVDNCAKNYDQEQDLVRQAQAELDAFEAKQTDLSRQLASAQAQSIDLATRAADRRNRLAQFEERRKALARERAEHQEAIAAQKERAADVRRRMQAVVAERDHLRAQAEDLSSQIAELDASAAGVRARQAEHRAELAGVQRSLERLQARHELLTRLREEGEGLEAGVRAVLQAGERTLYGVVGTVGQLLYVPEEYEVAIEAALGAQLENVIVESWPDAEAAITFLRQGEHGRVTFWPMEEVQVQPPLHGPKEEDVLGRAADLVHAEAWSARVAELLLGRTIVVRDLAAARRLYRRLTEPFQIVTLSGEVLRSSGSVTGGCGQQEAKGQVLAREREWRELPDRLEIVRDRYQRVEADLAEAQAIETQLYDQIAAQQVSQRDLDRSVDQTQARCRDLEREETQAVEQIAWRQGLVAQLEEEGQDLDGQQAALETNLDYLASESESTQGRIAALQAELGGLDGEALYQRLLEARTAAAVARGTWEHRRTALETLTETQSQRHAQIVAKRNRIEELEEERAALAQQIEAQALQEAVIRGWLASLSAQIEPAEAELADLEMARDQLEIDETSIRARLREAETSHGRALLALSQQEDGLQRLRRKVMDDFGLVEMEPTEGVPEQPPLPLGDMVSALPVVEALPEGLEEEIHQMKAQLRRTGSVNPNAPEEYAEVLDRYTFLNAQATDLDEAARSLREVIAELDDIMRHEFEVTFEAINARFRENFTELFGGGSAHLVLTDQDDLTSTGVEIVARPPGKRQQTLALLSGGERSLTAVALIFSILEVRPPPFCILDEVDAMLDEANIRRFRRALETLARETQFIIITHNRGTIEAANTIYGISMGDDSVSQAVALRFEGDRVIEPNGNMVELKSG
jgi:chromosome segregation protein